MSEHINTPTVRRITVDDLMAVTGLGPKQVRRLVRAGELPGRMVKRNFVCSPGEFDRYVAGDWTPRRPAKTVAMLHHVDPAQKAS